MLCDAYFNVFNPFIRSKCFLFNVAKRILFDRAIAAIHRLAMSICFRIDLRNLSISTADFAALLSKDKTFTLPEILPKKVFAMVSHRNKISYPVIAEMHNAYPSLAGLQEEILLTDYYQASTSFSMMVFLSTFGR